ncbi:unnamed protein product [Rotaria sp. Silwood2]|nr:unnamed protein product [Rotaria sp. Silwood2]CAF4442044.1 unnamed protein product [Rotaria sp. Silwood2]CAF4602867.1 unnamed protein product [Rotaria sp. Silwood2]
MHKQHSDQVKSIVDLANEEKKILSEHLEKIEKFEVDFTNEQSQLQQALKNIDISEDKSSQYIDTEFDRIIVCFQDRRKIYRDNIYLRQDNLKNINSSLNKCLEEGRCVLTLNDFAALAQSKAIIEKMNNLEVESVEYQHQTQLTDSVQVDISIQKIFEMISTFGTIWKPPTPSFVEHKCKANVVDFDIKWEPIESNPSITAYVYRGLETKYLLQDLKPSTSYILRLYACNRNTFGDAAHLEMTTLNLDLDDWVLSMSSTYTNPQVPVENTRKSLLDGQYTTGAGTNSGNEWIQATFPYPVPVASVTIGPLHKSNWGPQYGNGGTLQYSYDNNNWTTVGTIAYVAMQQQKIEIGKVTAQYWRLFHHSWLCTSSFIFKET